MIRYLSERTGNEKASPFFAYLAFSAPHWPLQCAEKDRLKYRGVYDKGPEVLRQERMKALVKLGMMNPNTVPAHFYDANYKSWGNMDEKQRKKSARAMETYAGMVDSIDQNVGRVMQYLESTGELDSTYPPLPVIKEA